MVSHGFGNPSNLSAMISAFFARTISGKVTYRVWNNGKRCVQQSVSIFNCLRLLNAVFMALTFVSFLTRPRMPGRRIDGPWKLFSLSFLQLKGFDCHSLIATTRSLQDRVYSYWRTVYNSCSSISRKSHSSGGGAWGVSFFCLPDLEYSFFNVIKLQRPRALWHI